MGSGRETRPPAWVGRRVDAVRCRPRGLHGPLSAPSLAPADLAFRDCRARSRRACLPCRHRSRRSRVHGESDREGEKATPFFFAQACSGAR
eukprot:70990-Chlamydomonas_euryale.AAC.3